MVSRVGFVVMAMVGCAHAPPGKPAPLGDVEVTALRDGEEASHSWHPGPDGTVLLFARNIMNEEVAETATEIADGFVRRCRPAYDAVAVVEPGLAMLWPGIEGYAEKELARRRSWRADCLERRTLGHERAMADAADQIDLVVDSRGSMRQEVLGGADPNGDIVVAAYDAEGTSVYVRTVRADEQRVGKIVDEAIAALMKGEQSSSGRRD